MRYWAGAAARPEHLHQRSEGHPAAASASHGHIHQRPLFLRVLPSPSAVGGEVIPRLKLNISIRFLDFGLPRPSVTASPRRSPPLENPLPVAVYLIKMKALPRSQKDRRRGQK
jgi:hypothetical protein